MAALFSFAKKIEKIYKYIFFLNRVPLGGAPSEDKDHALRPSLLWKENVHRLCLVRFATPLTLHKLPGGAFFNRSRSSQAQGGTPSYGGGSRSIKKVAGRQRSARTRKLPCTKLYLYKKVLPYAG
jgi:hypothetical protein